MNKDKYKSEGKTVFRCIEKRSKTIIFHYLHQYSTIIPIGAFVIMLHSPLKAIFEGGRTNPFKYSTSSHTTRCGTWVTDNTPSL